MVVGGFSWSGCAAHSVHQQLFFIVSKYAVCGDAFFYFYFELVISCLLTLLHLFIQLPQGAENMLPRLRIGIKREESCLLPAVCGAVGSSVEQLLTLMLEEVKPSMAQDCVIK